MTVLVVDDEEPARERLTGLLHAMSGLHLLDAASDGMAALEAIATYQPEAVFLDVQMPGLTGFDVVAALPSDRLPGIVFVTGYDRYALQAFEVNAVDYLLKPISESRLQEAVARLRERDTRAGLARLVASLNQGPPLQRIVAKQAGKWHVLPVDTIEAFITDHELVFAQTTTGRFLVELTLRELERRLDREHFVRVHKQAIVNIDKVRILEPTGAGGAAARLQNGQEIPISRRYVQSVRQLLEW